MSALVDTSVLVDHLRGSPDARRVLAEELDGGGPLFASVLTKVEILAGTRPAERNATTALFDALIWVEVSEPIADRAGALAAAFLKSHPGVDLVDYVIAATREELDIPLWTRNIKHFPMLSDLSSPY